MTTFPIIKPRWSVSPRVHAFTTTRQGGVSSAPYASLNLADHVGDAADAVAQNRQRLRQACPNRLSWAWLNQQHTTNVLHFNQVCLSLAPADAVWTDQPNQVCAVMTADCLPILLVDTSASLVCAVHAGWRGLAEGILSKTLKALPEQPHNLIAWIGPAISQAHFEVGEEVVEAFGVQEPSLKYFFKPSHTASAKCYADLAGIARHQLKQHGLGQIHLSGHCSYGESDRFYSYRRDGQTGRMATLIWLTP